MTLLAIFLCGIGNFVAQRAFLLSGHPLVSELPRPIRASNGLLAALLEFGLLLTAMLLDSRGMELAAPGYAIYTAINMSSAWLVVTHRV